jgi:CheY-like chemotaxis protein
MKILIVDDHPIYRKGLIALLDQMEPDTALLQVNDDAAQALALIAENDDLDGAQRNGYIPLEIPRGGDVVISNPLEHDESLYAEHDASY